MSKHHGAARDGGRLRRAILTGRARYRCERCGVRVTTAHRPRNPVSRRAELHHKTPMSEGGEHSSDNVELLCRGCHIRHHRKERRARMSPDRRAWADYLEGQN